MVAKFNSSIRFQIKRFFRFFLTILRAFAFHVSKKYQYEPLIFSKIKMGIKNAELYGGLEFFEKVAKNS
jgi:hypothetical protein